MGKEIGICSAGDDETEKNKTILDVELEQILTAGVAKWGPDNRAAAETVLRTGW